jgi:hypothetical protein
MAKAILIDEFHLTVYAPAGLPEPEYDAIRRALDERRFQDDLRRAARDFCGHYPALDKARIRLTR